MDLKKLIPTYTPIKNPTEFEYKFTIFTPIFNRADTLHRVFNSLQKQTYSNFELLLINDGSTDNSHEVALELIKSANFKVRYINNLVNRHKMACMIQGVELAKGEFFLPLDSDDECVENALEVFLNRYNSIPKKLMSYVSGVTCLCADQNGNLIGEKFKQTPFLSSSFKNRLNNLNLEEKWGFTKTDILKGISINPIIFSKGYIPEGIIWNLLSKHHFKTVYTNDVLRIYYLDTENSISKQSYQDEAIGTAVFSLCFLNWFSKDYFWKNPKVILARIYTLLRASSFLDIKKGDYIRAIEDKRMKTLFNLLWPFKKIIFKVIG
ncbi:glycosyltransferase family 2 protein [Xanthomarina sp. F1114]|uniref:glycosyltransferase family 2 protein n=1 Tax=Xanthomarina sp. F1114 TaxID=2996019 RepID=UPI00225E396D|nr:glycosyltransferase family 2 protein [Xanthomarina sp. F1114]MCX7548393.1 glycosyltransferase family 2 protein [Xanthomarina sp. F1114]